MAKQKAFNPFYALLVVVGVIFGVTTLMYAVMSNYFAVSVRNMTGEEAAALMERNQGWMPWIDRHGMTILLIEIAILAVATFAAIATDGYWTRLAETSDDDSNNAESGNPNSDSTEVSPPGAPEDAE